MRERQRERKRDRDRERERQTDRQTETERDRERQRETEREITSMRVSLEKVVCFDVESGIALAGVVGEDANPTPVVE